ncbi:hypothetical protein FB451DRAFT_1411106 [Mycena latifolia]|nr:hypothetical protein FB451DRAFT_1411106 [Mycena latifolia]
MNARLALAGFVRVTAPRALRDAISSPSGRTWISHAGCWCGILGSPLSAIPPALISARHPRDQLLPPAHTAIPIVFAQYSLSCPSRCYGPRPAGCASRLCCGRSWSARCLATHSELRSTPRLAMPSFRSFALVRGAIFARKPQMNSHRCPSGEGDYFPAFPSSRACAPGELLISMRNLLRSVLDSTHCGTLQSFVLFSSVCRDPIFLPAVLSSAVGITVVVAINLDRLA